jgi:hypothetical protein
MAGREDGAAAGAMEEGQDSKEVKCENSEDGSNTSRRCQGNDMISVQFMQKVRMVMVVENLRYTVSWDYPNAVPKLAN